MRANYIKSLRAVDRVDESFLSGWDDSSQEIAGVIAAIDGIDGEQFTQGSQVQLDGVYVDGLIYDGFEYVRVDEDPTHYGVYVRSKDGLSDHIEDFPQLDQAIRKGQKIAEFCNVAFEGYRQHCQIEAHNVERQQQRIAALGALRKRAGIEYTLWRRASQALEAPDTKPQEIDWTKVENDVIIESLTKYGRHRDEVVEVLCTYSPIRDGNTNHRDDINKQIDVLLSERRALAPQELENQIINQETISSLINKLSDAKRSTEKLAYQNRFEPSGLDKHFDALTDKLTCLISEAMTIEQGLANNARSEVWFDLAKVDWDDLDDLSEVP